MNRGRAALALAGVVVVALVLVSGGSGADPRTPAALPGLPPPFLGMTVVGGGELTVAIDAYGDVVDLRSRPAGRALIENPAERQAAGTVPAETGIVPRVRLGDGPALPLWRADLVRQRYLPGTSVVVTTARFGRVQAKIESAAVGGVLVLVAHAGITGDGERGGARRGLVRVSFDVNLLGGSDSGCREVVGESAALVCGPGGDPGSGATGAALVIAAHRLVRSAAQDDRRWLARARPLGPAAPAWARRLYERSLLTLRALTDVRSGALAAGARDGWAYVWPRDAATGALAFEAAGYRAEARRVARFLARLDLDAAARFEADGAPVPGRGPQGDSPGWVAVAAGATGIPLSAETHASAARIDPGNTPDYQESSPGPYLANALSQVDGPETPPYVTFQAHQPSSAEVLAEFGTAEGLVRRAGEPGSGLDSAAAWAVRPFAQPALFGAARETLVRLLANGTRFGITPGEGWGGGEDPWTAPTAWSAWAFTALARGGADGPELARRDRRCALRLLADLRRAATPAGNLPERVDARAGAPRSTTPLAWSHAFAVLALRELWPAR